MSTSISVSAHNQLSGVYDAAVDLPENPVGKVLELLQEAWQGFAEIELDEVVDFEEASATIGNDALYIERSEYPMCTQAWELSVEVDGLWCELVAYGVFTDRMVKHVGADPSTHTAMGVGYGLERLAMLRYGIDDIRKVDMARVA